MTIAELTTSFQRILGTRGLRPAAGTTVGVGATEVGIFAFGCQEDSESRVQSDASMLTADEVVELVEEAVDQFSRGGLLVESHGGSRLVYPDPCLRSAIGTDEALVVSFAGRCLHLPSGYNSRSIAMERFLAGGNAREVACLHLRSQAEIVATTLPEAYERPPRLLAVFTRGKWEPAEVGGLFGSLGTSQSLRSWNHGPKVVSTATCRFRLNSPEGSVPSVGGSVGDSTTQTRLLAQAEACERYLGGVIESHRVRQASFDEIREDAVDPNSVVSYLPWQHDEFTDLHAFVPEEQRLWVEVEDSRSRTRWMLADLVFYPFGWGNRRRHTGTSSSGMAAHTAVELAEFGAVAELVERDSFMRLWLANGRGREVVDWRSAVDPDLLAHLKSTGWQCTVLQIGRTPDQPVVLAVGTRERSIALGSSANEPRRAIQKAINELWATTTRDVEVTDKAPRTSQDVVSPMDHALFAMSGQYDERPSFVDDVDGEVAIASLSPVLSVPDDVYYYRWAAEHSNPFHVVRAISPSLIPISFGFGREPYGRADVRELVNIVPQGLHQCPSPHLFP